MGEMVSVHNEMKKAETATVKAKIELLQSILYECLLVLRNTPPNYYCYGKPNLWENARQHKMSLIHKCKHAISEKEEG